MSDDHRAPSGQGTGDESGRAIGNGAAWAARVSIALLALVSSITSITNGFSYDDQPLIVSNPRAHHLAHLGRLWAETYWPPWMGAGLYRPLTMSAFTLEWLAGHGAAWVFHATSIALYVVVCLLVYALAARILPRGPAWIAAALFAVHPVHVEAVGNVVGQSELWAACGVVGAVIAFVGWRRRAVDQWRAAGRVCGTTSPASASWVSVVGAGLGADAVGGVGHQVAIVALVVGACFAKEHAVVTPALLVAAELLLIDDPRSAGERWRALRPFALLLVVAVLGYIAVRMDVVGALAGDRPNVVLQHLSPAGRRWTMLGVVTEWTRLLAWPARLASDYAPRDIGLHEHFGVGLLPGVALLVLLAALLVLSVRRWPLGAFALAWTAATLVLVSNLIVPTGVLLAERTLFLPSVGAVILVGATIARFGMRPERAPAGARMSLSRAALLAGLALVVAAGAWRSAVRQRVWHSNATLFAQAPIDAPLSYRAHDVYAGLLFDHGDDAGGEREAHLAMALYAHDPLLYRDLAHEYMRAGLCRAAIPMLRRSIDEQGTMETDARLLLAECLLAQGDPRSARTEVLRGMATGYYPYYGPGYHKVLLAVDSALSRRDRPLVTAPTAHAVEHPAAPASVGPRSAPARPGAAS